MTHGIYGRLTVKSIDGQRVFGGWLDIPFSKGKKSAYLTFAPIQKADGGLAAHMNVELKHQKIGEIDVFVTKEVNEHNQYGKATFVAGSSKYEFVIKAEMARDELTGAYTDKIDYYKFYPKLSEKEQAEADARRKEAEERRAKMISLNASELWD